MDSPKFSAFLADVQSVFNMKISARQSEIWLKTFKDEDYEVAERMINLYYSSPNSENKPKPFNLMEMKSQAIAQLKLEGQYIKKSEPCKWCNSTGMIIIKRFTKGYTCLHDFMAYCFCENGNVDNYIERVNKNDIATEQNKFARYRMINDKSPLQLIDTQIHEYKFDRCNPTSEHLTGSEIKRLLEIETGSVKDEDKEKQIETIKKLFGGSQYA